MNKKGKGISLMNIGKCKIKECENKGTSIIRRRGVCPKCFSILKRDNIRRFKAKIEIPDSFKELKEKPKQKFVMFYDNEKGIFRRGYL